MKNKLNLLMLTIILALFSAAVPDAVFAQTARPQPVKTNAALLRDPDLKPINDNILTVAGKEFPKISLSGNNKKATQSCCNVGDTRNILAIDFYAETQPVKPAGKVTYENTTPYSPPSTCWVISSYSLHDISMTGSTRSLSAVPGGYSFVTSNQYQQTYEDLSEYITKLNILDKYKIELDKKIKFFTNNYSSYAQSLGVSNGSVLLYVRMESKGKYNGRSWYEGDVNTTETCCPPEIRDPATLKQTLQEWIINTVNALPNKGKKLFNVKEAGSVLSPPIKALISTTPQETPTPAPSPTP